MSKKVKISLIVVLLITLLIGGNFLYNRYFSVKGYIERVCKIEFPAWTSTEQEVDNGEFAAIGKYVLAESSRESFITDHQLEAYSKSPIQLTFTYLLTKSNRPNYAASNLYGKEDCNGPYSWTILTNSITGELWIEVAYPDFSGDSAPCDKLDGK